jgi:SPP1 gp7 family putative phage head morphogenesis protein
MPKRIAELESENRRLFDMLFRHHIYLEGVSNDISNKYAAALNQVYNSLAVFLANARYSRMDEFTLGELNAFINQFQRQQSTIYSHWTTKLIRLLKDFVAADVVVSRSIFSDLPSATPNHKPIFSRHALEGTAAANIALWDEITQEPIPASGLDLQAQIDAFENYASKNVVAEIRKAYANNLTNQELLAEVGGIGSNRSQDGLLAKFFMQNKALTYTVLQFLTSNVQSGIASESFERYRWVSILDSKTTEICRSRNDVIYVYGEGPVPPAHYNCRSKIVPEISGGYPIPQSYYEWLKQQPAEFQNDILGVPRADRLRSGDLKASDFSQIGTIKPLTISDFQSKIKFILNN